jgi:hypothetical protein
MSTNVPPDRSRRRTANQIRSFPSEALKNRCAIISAADWCEQARHSRSWPQVRLRCTLFRAVFEVAVRLAILSHWLNL